MTRTLRFSKELARMTHCGYESQCLHACMYHYNVGIPQMEEPRHYEFALAGAVMVLVGCLLLFYLLGVIGILSVLPGLLVGVGIIFAALGLVRIGQNRRVGKMYVLYGVVSFFTGAIWFGWAIQLIVAQYALALLLILFGSIFLLYSTATRSSYPSRKQTTTTETTTTTTEVCSSCGTPRRGQLPFCSKCSKPF